MIKDYVNLIRNEKFISFIILFKFKYGFNRGFKFVFTFRAIVRISMKLLQDEVKNLK